ncbi:DUF4834 family protein [Flavicella sp.]|uniref:DUF4834 family protein n=1 Tax=Flavicella sp. TaxID=2957742 RepID=UPI003019CFC3
MEENLELMIQEAGFVAFLRTIGIILLVIYGMKFFAKYFLPFILVRVVNKAKKRAQQRNTGYSQTKSDIKVGETIIDKKPNKKQSSQSNKVGDYVDYEEVD